jgi:hypothetical protein
VYPELKSQVIDVGHMADLVPAITPKLAVVEGIQQAVHNEPRLIALCPLHLICGVVGNPPGVVCHLMTLQTHITT